MKLGLPNKTIIFLAITALLTAGESQSLIDSWIKAGLPTEVPYGLENADTDGSPRFRIKVPIERLGDVVLEYSGTSRYVADSCLGHNWWFPLLESGVVEVDETKVVVRWPTGGETEMLRSDEPGVFHSRELGFTGRLVGDLFVVTSRGIELTFKKGRIWKLASEGSQVEWNYAGPRVTSIEVKGERLLELSYSKRTGILESIRTPGGGKLQVESAGVPVYYQGMLVALQQRVSRLVRGTQELFELIYEDQPENGQSVIQLIQAGNPDKILRSSLDGRTLLSDSNGTYTIRRDEPYSREYPRIDHHGKTGVLSSWFDLKKMSNFCVDAKGMVSEAKVVTTPGLGYGKLRGLVVKDAEGNLLSNERNYYDNEGKLLRHVSSSGGSRYYFKNSPNLDVNLGPKDTAFWFNKDGRLIKFFSLGNYYSINSPDDKTTTHTPR